MKDIKQFIIASSIVLFSLVAIDLIVGLVSDEFTRRLPVVKDKIAKEHYILNNMEKDIIVIGSSRGNTHYVTSILDDSINNYLGRDYSVYNAAVDGQAISSNSCVAESILNRYLPKLLIFEVTPWEFATKNFKNDLEFLAPHYKDNEIVRDYLNALGYKERALMQCNMYRYNGKLSRMALAFTQPYDSTGYIPGKGLLRVDGNAQNNDDSTNKVEELNYSQFCIDNFLRVINICKKQQVPVIITTSPAYKMPTNYFLRDLCKELNVPYIERYNTELFNNNPQWFRDANHLNDDGAHVYTKLFFQDLKPYLEQLK